MGRIKRKTKKCGKKITKEEVNIKPSVLPVTRLPTYGDMVAYFYHLVATCETFGIATFVGNVNFASLYEEVATDIKFVWSVLFPGVPTISGW